MTLWNGISGESHITLGIDFINSLFSGYSSPVFTNEALISGKIRRAKSKSIVLSLLCESSHNKDNEKK
jgi:hypothetical protein